MSNGTEFSTWLELSHSIPTRAHFPPRFKMADLGSLFFAFESQDDSHLLGDMLEDSDEVIILSAVCCFMRRNLTRIQDYFEQTLPRYLPDEFKHHFRMTRETCELLSLEIMQTGQIRNSSGWPVIAPQKQILAFLWRIANQEPARAVADRFDLTSSSVDRVFRRVVPAAVSLVGNTSNGQLVSHGKQNLMSEPFSLFYLKPGSKGRDWCSLNAKIIQEIRCQI